MVLDELIVSSAQVLHADEVFGLPERQKARQIGHVVVFIAHLQLDQAIVKAGHRYGSLGGAAKLIILTLDEVVEERVNSSGDEAHSAFLELLEMLA